MLTDHHRYLLRLLLEHVNHLEGLIAQLGARIEVVLAPFEEATSCLDTIPGGGSARGRDCRRGGRSRYGALPDRGPLGVVGGDVPGE